MTEEQKQILETIAKELNGKLQFWSYSDKYTEHQKIVIEYGHTKKTNDHDQSRTNLESIL